MDSSTKRPGMSQADPAGKHHDGPVVAIDGPAGAGKSTTARLLAGRLGFCLLDTGAIYRGVALHLTRRGIDPDADRVPADALDSINLRVELSPGSMKLFLGAEDITSLIRDEKIASNASKFSAQPEVRRALLSLQRRAAAHGPTIAEGRDMGTVVFPDAEIKFFLTANLAERSRRRHRELQEAGGAADLGEVCTELRARDYRDSNREAAPLACAPDALIIDTTSLTPDQVVEIMLKQITEKFPT